MTPEPCQTGTESGVVCARGGIGCPLTHEGHEPRYRGDKHLAYIRVGNGGPWPTTETLTLNEARERQGLLSYTICDELHRHPLPKQHGVNAFISEHREILTMLTLGPIVVVLIEWMAGWL